MYVNVIMEIENNNADIPNIVLGAIHSVDTIKCGKYAAITLAIKKITNAIHLVINFFSLYQLIPKSASIIQT